MSQIIFKSKINWLEVAVVSLPWFAAFFVLGEFDWKIFIVAFVLSVICSFYVSLSFVFYENGYCKLRYFLGFIPIKSKLKNYDDILTFQVSMSEGAVSIGGGLDYPIFILAEKESYKNYRFLNSIRSFTFKHIEDLLPLLVFLQSNYPDKLKFHVSKKHYPKEYEFVNKFLQNSD